MTRELFTIGHSDHPLDRFCALLAERHLTAVGDVRSQPYSRRNPPFDRRTIAYRRPPSRRREDGA